MKVDQLTFKRDSWSLKWTMIRISSTIDTISIHEKEAVIISRAGFKYKVYTAGTSNKKLLTTNESHKTQLNKIKHFLVSSIAGNIANVFMRMQIKLKTVLDVKSFIFQEKTLAYFTGDQIARRSGKVLNERFENHRMYR